MWVTRYTVGNEIGRYDDRLLERINSRFRLHGVISAGNIIVCWGAAFRLLLNFVVVRREWSSALGTAPRAPYPASSPPPTTNDFQLLRCRFSRENVILMNLISGWNNYDAETTVHEGYIIYKRNYINAVRKGGRAFSYVEMMRWTSKSSALWFLHFYRPTCFGKMKP